MSLTEKIAEACPAGTRPRRYMAQWVSNELTEAAVVDVIEHVKEEMRARTSEPLRFVVLDASEVDPVQDRGLLPLSPPDLPVKIVYGFTLGAVHGELPLVVIYKGDEDEGVWHERARFPVGPPMVLLGGEMALAESTGEVEVREDGALAEVYRVAAPLRHGLRP